MSNRVISIYNTVADIPSDFIGTAHVISTGNLYTSNATGKLIGKPIIRRTNVLTRCPTGTTQNYAGKGGFTFNIQAELAGIPMAVRIAIPNHTSGTPTIAGSFGFDTAMGDINSVQSRGGNVTTWYPLTFGGAASGTHAARVSATEPSWLWSDLIPCSALPRVDSESGAIIHTRLIQGTSGGDATSFSAMWTPHALVADIIKHQWRGCASTAAADYATTNQADFTAGSNSGSANATHIPCMIQYVSLTQGQTLLTIGDSITSGLNTGAGGVAANGYGWTAKLRDLLSTPEVPVELCNLGYSGATMAMISGIYTRNASELKNYLLLHTMYTPNSNDVVLAKKELVKSLAIMNSMGHVPIYWTGLPRNATVAGGGLGGTNAANLGALETQRVNLNTEILAGNDNTIDFSSIVSGAVVASGTAAGQMEYAVGNSDDGLHPNNAGHDKLAAHGYSYLRASI